MDNATGMFRRISRRAWFSLSLPSHRALGISKNAKELPTLSKIRLNFLKRHNLVLGAEASKQA